MGKGLYSPQSIIPFEVILFAKAIKDNFI